MPDTSATETFIPGLESDADVLVVQPSAIHGRGAYARAPLPAGIRVVQYVGEKITKAESRRRCEANNRYIFALDDHHDLDGSVERNPARFLNHSCRPNCEAVLWKGEIWIRTLRPIAAGEELTFNYGYDLEDFRDHPCRCGAANCAGYIVAEEYFAVARAGGRL
jgi:SET domain-containing protein